MSAPRKGSMADLARELGVSVSTVSRALSGSSQIGPEMRTKVRALAETMGYVVNPLASSLRTGRSRILLVLVPKLENYNFPALLRATERAAAQRGYTLMIGYVEAGSDTDDRLMEFLYSGAADGVIIATGIAPPSLCRRLDAGESWPAVCVLSRGDREDLPSICIDDRQAGRDVHDALRAAGYRRLAQVTGADGPTSVGRVRADGFAEGATRAGEPPPPTFDGPFSVGSGQARAAEIAALAGELDAVFCGNDEIAFGLVNGLIDLGIDVPGRLSVFGFDDIRFSSVFRPRLSTVGQPIGEIGETAVDELVRMIETGIPAQGRTMTHRIVFRDSAPDHAATRPVAAGRAD